MTFYSLACLFDRNCSIGCLFNIDKDLCKIFFCVCINYVYFFIRNQPKFENFLINDSLNIRWKNRMWVPEHSGVMSIVRLLNMYPIIVTCHGIYEISPNVSIFNNFRIKNDSLNIRWKYRMWVPEQFGVIYTILS